MNKGHPTGGEPIPDHQLQLNTRLVPTLVGLLLILQLAIPYQGWTILLVGLGGAWLTSYLWARSLARGLRLVREMRFGWAQVGDRLEERFTLFNDGWAPALWVELEDFSTLPDYCASTVRYVGGQASNRWHNDAVCTRRGLYTLGPTGLRTGDPLGLYTVRLHQPKSTTLMVMPPILPLPAIEVAPGGRAGEGRRPRAESLERTVSASSVRDYVPGDSIRWIHWRVSAHRDDLFVRIFDNTPASDWWIFLDLDQRVQTGQGWDSTEEHGVMLAASLAGRGLQAGRAVGMVAHGQDLVWLPPQVGDEQRLAILRALALVTPGPLPLVELLKRAQPASGQRPSLVVVTPAVQGDWIEALLPLLRRGVVPTVLLLDPASFDRNSDDPDLHESASRPAGSELTATMGGTLALLSDLGVTHYAITRDLLDRPEARPGRRGQWKWRVFATGRVVPVQRPRDTAWRALS
jgi:uncharacterized protein (DUF58 family)